jgi:hypothetical protein
MELIDKTALIAEIKRRIDLLKANESGVFHAFASEMIITEYENMLSFLDTLEVKKAEEKFERPSTMIEDSECVGSRMKYIDEDLKPVAKFILEFANWNLHKDEWNHPVLEVPLFRVLDALTQRGKPYNETCKDCETECPNFDEAQGTPITK